MGLEGSILIGHVLQKNPSGSGRGWKIWRKKRLRDWLEVIEKSVSMGGDENLDDDTEILVIVSLQNYKLIEGGEMA